MSMIEARRFVLPLVLDRVPAGLRQALAQEGVPFVDRRAQGLQGRFVLYDSRSGPPSGLASGQIAIDVDGLRAGWRGDPFEELLDERSIRCVWRIADFDISEEIARVDKRAVRSHLMHALRTRIEAAGGAWICLAAFPFPYRAAFNFRFDHDEYDPDDFDRVLRAISGYEQATSHFICGKPHEGYPEAMSRLRGLDVGSHGYLHHTYQDREDNLRNVARGIECLRRLGLEPQGFVAPHGRFNQSLLRALESLGITHSSEFGLAYDELPFFVGGGQVLQIPVHPVCLGLFLEAAANRSRDWRPVGDGSSAKSASSRLWFDQVGGTDSSIRRLGLWEAQRGVLNRQQEETVGRGTIDAAVAATIDHFCQVARSRYAAGEPIFLYGHPNGRVGRHPRLLKALFEVVSDLSACWMTTMSGLNHWWRARNSTRLRVAAADGGYSILVDHRPKGYRIAGEYWRGDHVAKVPLDEPLTRLMPESLVFESRKPAAGIKPWRVDPPHGLRASIRRYLDWERVTPLDEIRANTWRGWMKRALRRMRDK
jgi:hypothetical protein